MINQRALGLVPAVLAGVAVAPPIDNVDALYEAVVPTPPGFFALAAEHVHLGASGFVGCGGDLFTPLPGGPPAPALTYVALGLAACADDVDALQFDALTAGIYFSLAPLSWRFPLRPWDWRPQTTSMPSSGSIRRTPRRCPRSAC